MQKKSLVVPIHKKFRKHNVENYRPISLLSLNAVYFSTPLNTSLSAPLSVISGVPQGSILFLVYINNLPSVVDNDTTISLFADDSKCHRTISSVADCNGLQDDLDTMVEWSKAWRLRFNADKCEVLSVTRKRSPQVYSYSLDGRELKQVDSQKDLGVTVTKDLKWTEHVKRSVSKGYRMLGFLRRHVNKDFDTRTKRSLYLTLVRPSVGYATEVSLVALHHRQPQDPRISPAPCYQVHRIL